MGQDRWSGWRQTVVFVFQEVSQSVLSVLESLQLADGSLLSTAANFTFLLGLCGHRDTSDHHHHLQGSSIQGTWEC